MPGFFVTVLDYKDKWAGHTMYIPERKFLFKELLRNNEIKKLNDKITKLYVFQTTGKIPTIEEWLE